MLREHLLARWHGVLLSLIGIAAVSWLALSGRLGWYIHPRYFDFTVGMAIVAGIASILTAALLPRHEPDDAHEHQPVRDTWRRTLGAIAVVLLSATALLILPPATLTTATVEQREMNAGTTPTGNGDLADRPTEELTVRDWSVLLRQGGDDLLGKRATLLGFVTPDPDDPDNVFYVARFVVNCCAVDAQPVGVPVHLPDWQETLEVDSWVTVSGAFATNPSPLSQWRVALHPLLVEPTTPPEDPYVY